MTILEEFFIDMENSDFDNLHEKCQKLNDDEKNFVGKVLVAFDMQNYAY